VCYNKAQIIDQDAPLVRYIAENEDDALTLRDTMPKAYLVLLANGRVSHSFPLRGEIQLGRDKSNGVVIADQKVSRHHALLSPVEDSFMLNDQGSANGTYLNGVLISQPTRLKDRDRISLGDTNFIFTLQSPDSGFITSPAFSSSTPPAQAQSSSSSSPVLLNNRPLWLLVGCLGLAVVGLLLTLAMLIGLFIGSNGTTGLVGLGLL
jgi:hypothetical protein